MVLGYFLYESLTFGVTTAIPSIPGNLVQGGVSAFAAVPIIIALSMARLSINIDK
jgi:uncharacterized membrane protein